MRFRSLISSALLSLSLTGSLAGCAAYDDTPDESSFLTGLGDEKSDGLGTPYTAKAAWSAAYEAQFSDWIRQLGRARADGTCTKVADCLQSEVANSLRLPEDDGLQMFADCADLPYVLRAYFSYKKRLPFSFVSEIDGMQYTAGNTPVARRSHKNFTSFASLTKFVANHVHSGFYRMAPEVENNDLYPIDIDRSTVRPGAVYYDPNGHVLVVYDVQTDGTVLFIDGHPDNSLTHVRFGSDHARGSAAQGGGFHQWRAQKLVGSTFKLTSNANSAGYSATAQYQSSFSVDGQTMGYYDWVRARLNLGGAIDPVKELTDQMDGLCDALRTRVTAVADGAPMASQPHPGELPPNIYGAEGDWEAYSTPGRDARLKLLVRNLYELIRTAPDAVASGSARYAYDGSRDQLVDEFKATFFAKAGDCSFSYRNSAGTDVALDILGALPRLFALSFDPYHCPELRWGASSPSELATCPKDPVKQSMYDAEQSLRNIIDRDGLTSTPLGSGPASAPDLDLIGLLYSL